MGNVLNSLKAAYRRDELVDVYRIDDIFFTGYVYLIDEINEELVLRTYDEWGIPDGMVYLTLSSIYDVELGDSDDLKHIKRRIQLADEYHFEEIAEPQLMPLNKLSNLRLEILGRSYVDGQIVMVATGYDNKKDANYKGLVEQIDNYHVTLLTVNKTNFADHRRVQISLSDIHTIEFLGKELTLLTKNQATLFGPSYPTQQIAGDDEAVNDVFENSKQTHQLVEIESAAINEYSYVGYVINYNHEFVIFNLVNMSGQFGGYVLLRRSMVKNLCIQSDYLQLIKQFVKQNRDAGTFVEPVLNDEREFDMTEDALITILQQAIKFKRLVRIAQPDEFGQLGYPLSITPITQLLNFEPVDSLLLGIELPTDLHLQSIGEVSFDYLEAFFVDDALKNSKES
ncbi:hypothetical protein ACYATP_01505 [Lactobacillaceae bacterium Melli_B4]